MKYVFAIILLVSTRVFCQDIPSETKPKRSIYHYNTVGFVLYKHDFKKTHDKIEPVQISVVVDLKKDKITVFSEKEQDYFFYNYDTKYTDECKSLIFSCTDLDGVKCVVTVENWIDGTVPEYAMVIEYADLEFIYQMESTD